MREVEGIMKSSLLWRQPCRLHSFISQATRLPLQLIGHSCFIICSLLFIVGSTTLFAQKRNITEKDLFSFQWIGDPQISPDGLRVAFVRVVVNQRKDGYDTSIWTVGTSGNEPPQPLTSGKHDLAPRWSPDSKRLAFVRATETNGRPGEPQIAILSMTGGEAVTITSLPKGASSPLWSPDGTQLLFISTTSPEDMARQRRGGGERSGG